MSAPVIEVRNVREIRAMSEETMCFHAVVYVDGEKAGTVENDGKGGANRYQPWSLKEAIDAYARTLPPFELDGTSYPHEADTAIGDLVIYYLALREYKRLVSAYLLFVDQKGRCMRGPRLPRGADVRAVVDGWRANGRLVGANVLNLLPATEGFELFRKHAGDPHA